MRVLKIFGLLSAVIPFSIANPHVHHWGRRHQDVAVRARGDVAINKRSFDNARFTFYDVGLGACGQTNVASDFIVALNVDQYGSGYPGPECFQSITISYGGKTAQATIMDECMGCPYGGLDFSRGLFDYFASESEGVLYGSWWFNDGSATTTSTTWSDTTTSTSWTPTTTSWSSTSTWTPTPTWTPTTSSSSSDTPTSTPTPTLPTTSQSSSAVSSSSFSSSSSSYTISSSTVWSSSNYNSGVASGIAVPTGTAVVAVPDSSDPQNLLVINEAVIYMGIMIAAGAGR